PWRIVVVFLGVYVHGQLLVFPCQRSDLFYLPFVRGRASCKSRTMGLSCASGDDCRFPWRVSSLPGSPPFMFLCAGTSYRALLVATSAHLANICATGGGSTSRSRPWRYFERKQLLRAREQSARLRSNPPRR